MPAPSPSPSLRSLVPLALVAAAVASLILPSPLWRPGRGWRRGSRDVRCVQRRNGWPNPDPPDRLRVRPRVGPAASGRARNTACARIAAAHNAPLRGGRGGALRHMRHAHCRGQCSFSSECSLVVHVTVVQRLGGLRRRRPCQPSTRRQPQSVAAAGSAARRSIPNGLHCAVTTSSHYANILLSASLVPKTSPHQPGWRTKTADLGPPSTSTVSLRRHHRADDHEAWSLEATFAYRAI